MSLKPKRMRMSLKPPSLNEIDYFKKLEIKRMRAAAEAKLALQDEAEQERSRELHYMHCPKCGALLLTMDRFGFQVETCPGCKGTWLDAGELEGILEHEDSGLLRRIMEAFRPGS